MDYSSDFLLVTRAGREGGAQQQVKRCEVGGMLRRLQFEGSDSASLCSNMPLFFNITCNEPRLSCKSYCHRFIVDV